MCLVKCFFSGSNAYGTIMEVWKLHEQTKKKNDLCNNIQVALTVNVTLAKKSAPSIRKMIQNTSTNWQEKNRIHEL